MAKRNEGRNILVSRFSALGDVAMTVPALYEACRANPGDHFFMLTRNFQTSIFINPPSNLTLVGVNLDEYSGVGGLSRLAAALYKEYSITDYADLHDVLRTKLLRLFMRLRGVRVCHINKGRKEKRQLTRPGNKVMLQLTSTIDRYRSVFSRLGLSSGGKFNSLFDNKEADVKLFSSVSEPPEEGEVWVGIAPFAKHKGKMYPLDLMEKVVEELSKRNRIRIFIFGAGTNEEAAIEDISRRYPNIVNMAAHKIGFAGELALMSRCRVMLSMDSANMHLASLAGVPVVSVWGATHPYCGFMGWQQREEDTVQLDMTCRPCSVFGNKPCLRGDYHCLRGISPRVIIQRLRPYLNH